MAEAQKQDGEVEEDEVQLDDEPIMNVVGDPQSDEDANAALLAGFDDEVTETPAKSKDGAVAEDDDAEKKDTPKADDKPADKPAAPPEQKQEPKFRQVTEDEWNTLTAKAASVDTLRADMQRQLDKAFGLTGKLKQDLERAVASQGIDVEVTDDLVDEMVKDFPEVGEATLGVMKKFAAKLKKTAIAVQAVKDDAAQSSTAVDPKEVEARIEKVKKEMRAESARELLALQHDDWETTIGLPDEKGVVPETDYRKWLKTQPADYQEKLNDSWNPVEIGKSITKFKQAQSEAATAAAAAAKAAEEADKPSKRNKQLAAAVVRRGAGGPVGGGGSTAAEEFAAGYNED